ncbi:MAG: 50S ribosomal protein L1 [bacterium TMED198]|nr:MAG: 50S ribosomal protein L1 [bacterium TMED198]
MMKNSKRYNSNFSKIDRNKMYSIDEAVKLIKSMDSAKFDETVDISFNLGVDPKHSDQLVRGTVSLPNGTGKDVKVLVVSKGEKLKEAENAGADFFGSDEILEKIKSGWLDFDVLVATPDMMADLGKLGRFLGPRGLMPNPKSGTVTNDIEKAVKELKAGKIQFRTEKTGIIHAGVGKVNFKEVALIENIKALTKELNRLKPSSTKGIYMKKINISSSMGPGIKVDLGSIVN